MFGFKSKKNKRIEELEIESSEYKKFLSCIRSAIIDKKVLYDVDFRPVPINLNFLYNRFLSFLEESTDFYSSPHKKKKNGKRKS